MKTPVIGSLALLLAGGLALPAAIAPAAAQDRPEEIHIGITTFLSGPASVFGVPGRDAAEILIEQINAGGGIDGVPIRATFVDEGPGVDHVVSEYRRLVEDVGVDATFASISSAHCMAVAPVAEDFRMLNFMWDCGTQRIFEENDYDYVFRPQAYATAEMVASVLYMLTMKPEMESIAVVNQDYAWGRESWEIFRETMHAIRPEIEVVAELFPSFGSADYSTEISRLSAQRPDVILSTSWGGDLDTFVRQSSQRGLMDRSTFVLPLAESSLERLGDNMPEGVIVGGRGDHWFLHPDWKDNPEFTDFVERFREETGNYPIYPVYHMAQSLNALQAAYERALETNDGAWPTTEDLAAAMNGLEFPNLVGGSVTIREDNQGLEDQLLGTTVRTDAYDFAVLDQMILFPAEMVTAPVGEISVEWVKTLDEAILSEVPEPVALELE